MEHVHVCSVVCACVYGAWSICVRSMCMCVCSMCMCVRSMCMCAEQRAVISRIVAYVCMELSMYVASSHMCVCV